MSIAEKVEALLAALVQRERLALMPDATVPALTDRFCRDLEKGEVHSLTQLDDWLMEQDDVDDLYFDDTELLQVAAELGLTAKG
jgi:hypothetical protein